MSEPENKEISVEEAKDLESQASEFLKSGYYFAAYQFYQKLSRQDPDNRDFHVACLLSQNSLNEEKDLPGFYQDLYSDDRDEIALACEKDEEHIGEMLEKCYVPGYLEKEEIARAYEFDLTYRSTLHKRQQQKEDMERLIDQDEHLLWLKQNDDPLIGEIMKVYDKRLEKAQQQDSSVSEKKKNDYQRFLYRTYAKVKKKHAATREKREKDYNALISRFEKSDDIVSVSELIPQFEQFGDFEDSLSYVSKCAEKIEELKKQADEDSLRRNIEESITSARNALEKEHYGEAYDGFARAIALDPDNEDGHLGILMAQSQTKDPDALFEYYLHLYDDPKAEMLTACEEDEKHISEMCEKYYLKDYLEKETIRAKYQYDRTFESYSKSREKEREQIIEDTKMNPVFMWLKENGSELTQQKIKAIYDEYDRRLDEARKQEEDGLENIRKEYQRFLFNTYAQIKKLYKSANQKKDEEYKRIIRAYNSADKEDELMELIDRLALLGEFKESKKYVRLCQKKIDDIREKEKNVSLMQEIETTLIAGRAYLASGNPDLADESFAKVLTLDPDNPYAYLGILMIETGCRDMDELSDYYIHLFDDDVAQSVEACEANTEHIEEIAERYELPGYLEKDVIRRYYNFDRSFQSDTESRLQQKEQLHEEFEMNPLLNKILDRKDKTIGTFFDTIEEAYDKRISESKEEDRKQTESIEHIYKVYLDETDKSLANIYEQKLKERNEELEERYADNLAAYETAEEVEELQILLKKFEADIDYKDSREYADRIRSRVRTLRMEKEKDYLESLLKKGRESLEKRLYEEAQENYVAYLDIDPENEEAQIGLLRAETMSPNLDALFDYYKDLYVTGDVKTLSACEPDAAHIEDIAGKSTLPGVLEKDEIVKMYDYDLSYESSYDARIEEKKQLDAELEINPSLVWLKEKGSDKIREQISDLVKVYEGRIETAQREDKEHAESIAKAYKTFLRNKDREVRALYNSLLKQRNEEKRLAEKERKTQEMAAKADEERSKRRKAQDLKDEVSRKEAEEKKKKDAEKEERLRVSQKAELERRAKERLEREQKAQERAERFKTWVRGIKIPKPNIGILAAIASLAVFGLVSYFYLYVPGNKYQEAVALAEEGRYDEAIEIFEALGSYKDSAYQVKSMTYKKADSLYESGDPVGAVAVFDRLRFDDSQQRVDDIRKELFDNAKEGSPVLFGRYEQDGDESDGEELIEWIVLEVNGNDLMLVSRYGLDNQVYNSESAATVWRDCELRGWLNSIFLNSIADFNERNDILPTVLENQLYEAGEEEEEAGSYVTQDKIFIFDGREVEEYFPDPASRQCEPTKFAVEEGAMVSEEGYGSWWLRSVGNGEEMVEYVWNRDGSVASSVQEVRHMVRPVLWLHLD